MNDVQGELEKAYLGTLCIYSRYLEDPQDFRWFEFPEHKMLLSALMKCWNGKDLNTAQLFADYPTEGEMYLDYMDASVSQAQYEYYREQLKKNHDKKRIVELAEQLDRNEITQAEFYTYLEDLHRSSEKPKCGLPEHMVDLAISTSKTLKFSYFLSLSRYLRITENTVTTIAAFTSRGKSTFAMNLANDLRKNYPVIYFNLEMNQIGFSRRLLAMNTGIPMGVFSGMKPTAEEYERMLEVEKSLKDGNFSVYNGTQSAQSIRAIVNRCSKPPVIFVDHINYLSGNPKLQEREQISESMKILNGLAKDGKATVFVLAQINRDGEDKSSLSNLQGSSSIEQDSDNVLILEPEESETDPSGYKKDLKMIVKASKVRDGAKGILKFLFRKDKQQFVERV